MTGMTIKITGLHLAELVSLHKEVDTILRKRTQYGTFSNIYSHLTTKEIRDRKINALRDVQKKYIGIVQILCHYIPDPDKVDTENEASVKIYWNEDSKPEFLKEFHGVIVIMKEAINEHLTEEQVDDLGKEKKYGTLLNLLRELKCVYENLVQNWSEVEDRIRPYIQVTPQIG